ncbi:MAG: hypothetical protein ACRCVA_24365 [Phreatobacter sp.]
MRDGLYRLRFQSPLGWGTGVLHVRDGRLWGGDGGFYFIGTQGHDGNRVTLDVTTHRHSQRPGLETIFGQDEVHVRLVGTPDGGRIMCDGTVDEMPGAQFLVELVWLAD